MKFPKVILIIYLSSALSLRANEKIDERMSTNSIELVEVGNIIEHAEAMAVNFSERVRVHYLDMNLNAKQQHQLEETIQMRQKLFIQTVNDVSLKKELAAIYDGIFSDEELKELIEFYKSAVGQKLLTSQNDVSKKMNAVIQHHLQITEFNLKHLQRNFEYDIDAR